MATATHTEVPDTPKGRFPPFDKETFASQLFWLAVCFILLYVLMARVAVPRIGGIMAARRARIDGDLAEAVRLKASSDAAIASYEKSLADARGRAQALANETRVRLNAEAEETRKTLDAELNAKLAAAEQTIGSAKSAALANVRGIATGAAGAIVERLIGMAPAPQAVETAINAALKG